MNYRRVHATDFPHGTIALARALIGCALVRDCPDGRSSGRIVETEAYVLGDHASHAYCGMRPRNASMFLAPFHAYVYLIYGTSYCFNVSSEPEGDGAAVLIRALEPIEGVDLMRKRSAARARDLLRGPGRICRALAIDSLQDGVNLLTGRDLWLAAAEERGRVRSSRRIGISKAAHRRLRFYEANSPFLSGPRHLSP